MAARSRSVGRYDLVVEIAKSQLGPLWAATVAGASGLEFRLVRCVALGTGATARDVDALADAGRWSSGFSADQAVGNLDVVATDRDLALVTSYVHGETLRSLLRLANFKREPMPARIALALTLDVCRGLSAAEARAAATARDPEFLWGGLLPDSVLVGADGRVRLLDLGVASTWRRVSTEARHPEVTAYSAPEPAEPSEVPANADVFTLGIVLWEMLSGGKRLFAGTSQRVVLDKLRKFRTPTAASLPDAADANTRTLLASMLEPDPHQRLSGVAELTQRLEALGDALAPAREIADFVTRVAAQSLDSRERTLRRALERGGEPSGRRPASEPPPAKPLPLPAHVKLGGRPAAFEGRVPPPPPPPVRALIDIDGPANDHEETGSVRAEDILAALAVEDLEPETARCESEPEPEPEPEPELAATPASELDVAEPAAPSTPSSSGRRAPLTAVVVPSVVAGPDATFTPVPSVLQTLRGPGVPPLGSDALGLTPELVGSSAGATRKAALPSTQAASPASAPAPAPAVPGPLPSVRTFPAHGVLRVGRQRLSPSLVAAVGGTTLLLLIALVSASGDEKPDSAAEPASKLLSAERAESDRRSSAEQPKPADQRAPAPDTGPASLAAATPAAIEAPSPAATAETDVAKSTATTPEREGAAPLAVAATPRAVAPRPARRSSAAARPTTSTTKKKKIRATRKYIPAGI